LALFPSSFQFFSSGTRVWTHGFSYIEWLGQCPQPFLL
jgi:hypothetical protein